MENNEILQSSSTAEMKEFIKSMSEHEKEFLDLLSSIIAEIIIKEIEQDGSQV